MDVIFSFRNLPGFGDNLRGLISVMQILNDLNKMQEKIYILHIDFSKSKISKFIKQHPTKNETESTDEFVRIYGDDKRYHLHIEHFLLNTPAKCVTIHSNLMPDMDNITPEIKKNIKELFVFQEYFYKKLDEYLQQLPEVYNLYHFRFGDSVLVTQNSDENDIFSKLNIFQKEHSGDSCLIISDSLVFKQKIFDLYANKKVYVFLNRPTHTYDENTNEIDDMDVFIDFMFISKASNLYCYSNYSWISNFVLWTSMVYDVPLHNIKY